MKPFDIERVKAGDPVCTLDGHKVRVLCFDLQGSDYPIAAAIYANKKEWIYIFTEQGIAASASLNYRFNLCMADEKPKFTRTR